jgi:hypothetical protein
VFAKGFFLVPRTENTARLAIKKGLG